MQRRKLLIIDPSDDFCSMLADIVKGKFEIKICYDGESGLNVISEWDPDMVVINPILRRLDGITMLQRAAEKGHCPGVLMVTAYSSEYVEEKARQMNIGYLMLKPCPLENIAERLYDMQSRLCAPTPDINVLTVMTTQILEELRIENHRDGFFQLQAGIPMLVQNRQLRLSKELYPAIGEYLKTDYHSMEKTIREAIHIAWLKRDDAVWGKYFPVDENGRVIHLTNKSFMLILADHLRTQKQQETAKTFTR